MLSSMTPTILAKDGQLFMVTGSPGGRTIINTVLETIVDVVDFGMNAQEAVDAPRFHHQWLPDGSTTRSTASRPTRSRSSSAAATRCAKAAAQGVAQVIVYNAKDDMLEGGTRPARRGWRRGRRARTGRARPATARTEVARSVRRSGTGPRDSHAPAAGALCRSGRSARASPAGR